MMKYTEKTRLENAEKAIEELKAMIEEIATAIVALTEHPPKKRKVYDK